MNKHPPFKVLWPRNETDFFSWFGANQLCRMIKDAWAEVGVDINPIIERAPELSGASPSYVVRLPMLINGMPTSTENHSNE